MFDETEELDAFIEKLESIDQWLKDNADNYTAGPRRHLHHVHNEIEHALDSAIEARIVLREGITP
ncbi:MAG: hypothetical protein Q8Q12_00600 [bacterium]|nr:hypothetical protein [bacterium]